MAHKHTPGPWALEFGAHDAAIHAGGTIAMIDDTMTGWQANARLIAAAPDLLAAAEKALQAIEGDWERTREADELRNAIAKAKGD